MLKLNIIVLISLQIRTTNTVLSKFLKITISITLIQNRMLHRVSFSWDNILK